MAYSYWNKRKDNIKKHVSMRRLIDYYQVPTQGEGEETQVSCCFHGEDEHASARIYSTNTMYCWVCNKVWDVISFIVDYENKPFKEACTFLEQTFNIPQIDVDEAYAYDSNIFAPKKEKIRDFEKDFQKINNFLIRNRLLFSLDSYVKHFHHYDMLYNLYKSDKFEEDGSLDKNLSEFYKQISYNL